MSFRACSALLLLLVGCAATAPQQPTKQHNQIAVPWAAPLAGPKPIVLPSPVGLTPPVTVMVDPGTQLEPEAAPSPDSSRSNRGPSAPVTAERRPECAPIPVPHRGGDDAHNKCADTFPPNRYPGRDVLVNGKRFDALQVGVRMLWEIKTDRFETYSLFLQNQVLSDQVEEFRDERAIAQACDYGFTVGVSSEAHRAALEERDRTLTIVVTGCPR
ncbi:DUF6310 domain-containing protein [Hyalangium rubrum]|uniref:DUF6310 domain-containing protein n=1 Tax=Hyalangium rubrum TaxID=3103134 RepID=A0ABU5HEJ4_9BACT|nr:DUF6310 domain-containing protein [Hyalangium sp. s54d21]MDY7231889.1 DUF6310 domain-containing protein [Hyalangium sp. s54d21]